MMSDRLWWFGVLWMLAMLGLFGVVAIAGAGEAGNDSTSP